MATARQLRRLRIPGPGIEISALRADRSPIVYLHALNFDAWTFEPFLRAVGGTAIDLRGHGHSSAPAEGYWLGALAADVGVALRAVARGPVTLIGQSLGARVALAVAATFPWAVGRLVLIEGGVDLAEDVQRALHGRMRGFPTTFTDSAHALAALRAAYPLLDLPAARAIVRANYDGGHWRSPTHARTGIVRSWNLASESLAQDVSAPTLVVRADASHHWTRAQALALVDRFPGERRLVETPGNHYLLQTAPGALLSLLANEGVLPISVGRSTGPQGR